jgi:hypothetical protein
MALSNYQMQVGSLVMGPGTPFLIDNVQGLGQPDRRVGDQPRPLADGDFMGSTFLASRQVIIDLTITGSTAWDGGTPNPDRAAQALANLSALSLAWRGSPALSIAQPGWGTRSLVGQPRRLKSDDRQAVKVGRIPVTLEYYSPYPAMFSPAVVSGVTPSASPTWTYPLGFPHSFGTYNTGLTATANNSGDYGSYPVIVVSNPNGGFTITRSSDSLFFGLDIPGPISGAVTFDMDARTVVDSLGNNLRRYMRAGSSWLQLAVGADTYTLVLTTPVPGPWIQVTSQSAWLA